MKIGILTSGGDCAGLNAVIYAIGKYVTANIPGAELVGIPDGYGGLIAGKSRPLTEADFGDILHVGGTILGTSRQPYKSITEDTGGPTRLARMTENYRALGLDCLLTLGGAGTHRTAALLAAEGCSVIGLPKTIDNDIYGTDVTFGFSTAVDVAAECLDRVRTTAASHNRAFLVELMGNKAGWLTLYAGIAAGADIILIPEIPFDTQTVAQAVSARADRGLYSLLAVAEGALTVGEAAVKRKDMLKNRKEQGYVTATARLAEDIGRLAGVETRLCVPGHLQRGGSPSAFDRLLCTRLGAFAGSLIAQNRFGVTVAVSGGRLICNPLEYVAGRYKRVPEDSPIVAAARSLGVCFGEARP